MKFPQKIAIFWRWWGQEGNVPNLGSTEQSTVVLIEIFICDAVLIWLNGNVSSNAFCVVETRLAHFLPDPIPPPKSNI